MEVASPQGPSQAQDPQGRGSPASQEHRASAGRNCPRVAAFAAPQCPAHDLFSDSLFSNRSQDVLSEDMSGDEESEEVVKNTILNRMTNRNPEETTDKQGD